MQDAVRTPYDSEAVGERPDVDRHTVTPNRIVLAPTSTESFWLLRLYRKLMPRALRSRVARWVSPEVRNRFLLKASAGGPLRRLADRRMMLWYHLRHRRLVAPAGRGLARARGRVRLAEIRAGLTPTFARRETLDLVCAGLTAAGVPYFCLRPLDDRQSAVGVADADRGRAIRALAAACAEAGAYVGDGDHHRFGGRAWRSVASAPVLRIVRYYSTPDGRLVLGEEHGCTVEFWTREEDDLVAPRPNRVAERVPADGRTVGVPEACLTTLSPYGEPYGDYPTRPEFTARLVDDVAFPIDVVYTWVDGADEAWRARRDAALEAVGVARLNRQAANDARYISRDELRYSLRGVAAYAPWVRHIWIVTDGQVPPWLDADHPKVTVVDHRDIFDDRGVLPTFNSHAIESQLHHIEGLAEHFLYFNDDFFLGRPVRPAQFFQANGVSRFFTSKAQVALGDRSVADLPVLAAGKNNRRLIEEAFGPVVTQKMKHVPYALRRSVLAEIEERFAKEAAETARHQFRHPDDIAIPSSLHHYYAFLTGRAAPGHINYSYTDLAARETPYRLRRMLSLRRFDVFCLNDTDSDAVTQARQLQLMSWFLDAYFPVPSPYEKR
ncbi:stealth family protein [Actinoallomurus iriomotensis]|uniref:Exopolysaccharide phosphotransferase n=1 Tax=Actinoallomurus iriomotensis TaxID=478107 RepID=A0A9W6VYH1_9ACTN|nr:stealth family protein [Actinoallomurus iriomotensis]GLY84860.1 exopolysaccharide phosphotransferase [Actinoallomurus iriomotensis]